MTERICAGIFGSMLWHWSSMNATPARGAERVRLDHLVHDPEELERVGRAHHQVVVGVEAGVEVEAAQPPRLQQQRDDELDVHAGRVVPGVHHHHRPLAEGLAVQQAGAPVGHVGGVEGRLEQLVLEQHPLTGAEPLVDRRQRLRQPVLAGGDVVLARVVGAVGEPQLQVLRAGRVHDVDALQQVRQRLLAHPRVGVADAAEPVVVILEDVGVDGADFDAVALGVRREGRVVVNLVPRDVHRHARGDAGVLVHLRGVVGLLERRRAARPAARTP